MRLKKRRVGSKRDVLPPKSAIDVADEAPDEEVEPRKAETEATKMRLKADNILVDVLLDEREDLKGGTGWFYFWVVVGSIISAALNAYHVSSIFENSLHFSHLSTAEREMTLKTEMGFYYKFYKKLTQSEQDYWENLARFKRDNETEWPKEINDFQRFNIAPEVLLGYGYWAFKQYAEKMGWPIKDCYGVEMYEADEEGEPKRKTVVSCVGPGVPIYFYLNAVWILSGMTAGCLFALGSIVSSSPLGGLLAVLCFFCNHGHATRVQWTPTLRESFGYPLFLMNTLLLTALVKARNSSWVLQLFLLLGSCLASAGFLLSWQLAQFALVVKAWIVFVMYCFGALRAQIVYSYLIVQGGAVALVYSTMHGNNLLASGILVSALLGFFSIGATLGPTLRRHLPPMSAAVAHLGFAFMNTIGFKIELSNYLGVSGDDSHVFNLVRAKVGTYRDFDTLLYLGQPEFRQLPGETWMELCKTFLLPIVFGVVLHYVVLRWGKVKYWQLRARFMEAQECFEEYEKKKLGDEERKQLEEIRDQEEARRPAVVDPVKAFHFCLTAAFAVVASAIMRLKLFFTPQLCVLAALAAAPGCLPRKYASKRLWFLLVLIAAMSVQGWINLSSQLAVNGEASTSEGEEELLRWIDTETPPQASFAGDMVTMASVNLMTSRPIVNHPHFEDADARRRTESVYQAFSRRPARHLHAALRNISADFLVLAANLCLDPPSSRGSLLGIWDTLEPELAGRRPPLCPVLYDGRLTAPFTRVFLNDEYSVLRVDAADG